MTDLQEVTVRSLCTDMSEALFLHLVLGQSLDYFLLVFLQVLFLLDLIPESLSLVSQ